MTRVPGPCGALPAGSLQASGSAPPCTGRPVASPALMAPAELSPDSAREGWGEPRGSSHRGAGRKHREQLLSGRGRQPRASLAGQGPAGRPGGAGARLGTKRAWSVPPEGGSTAEAQALALGPLPHPQLRKLRPRKDACVLVLSRDPKGCQEPNHCPLVATRRSSPVPSRASGLLQVKVSVTLLTSTPHGYSMSPSPLTDRDSSRPHG